MAGADVAPAKPPKKKKTADQKRRANHNKRCWEKFSRTCMDCLFVPFLLCASCYCHSWVAKKKKEEEHAKAKKGRERRKAEAEAKAEEKDAEARPDLAKPISSLTTA